MNCALSYYRGDGDVLGFKGNDISLEKSWYLDFIWVIDICF